MGVQAKLGVHVQGWNKMMLGRAVQIGPGSSRSRGRGGRGREFGLSLGMIDRLRWPWLDLRGLDASLPGLAPILIPRLFPKDSQRHADPGTSARGD